MKLSVEVLLGESKMKEVLAKCAHTVSYLNHSTLAYPFWEKACKSVGVPHAQMHTYIAIRFVGDCMHSRAHV
jgi:hypothetical protein